MNLVEVFLTIVSILAVVAVGSEVTKGIDDINKKGDKK